MAKTVNALEELNEPGPRQPTLYEQLWQKLDGAYARWRRYRDTPHKVSGATPVKLDYMHGRVMGLLQAVAIMSQGAMDEEAVRRETVKRWRERQPKKPVDKALEPEDD